MMDTIDTHVGMARSTGLANDVPFTQLRDYYYRYYYSTTVLLLQELKSEQQKDRPWTARTAIVVYFKARLLVM